ncbi:hypothetical protein J6590_046931 [Homalodisca vitripennis]|nr:hypothetical protein J6590_046931 [Homalodisca vitripennis]
MFVQTVGKDVVHVRAEVGEDLSIHLNLRFTEVKLYIVVNAELRDHMFEPRTYHTYVAVYGFHCRTVQLVNTLPSVLIISDGEATMRNKKPGITFFVLFGQEAKKMHLAPKGSVYCFRNERMFWIGKVMGRGRLLSRSEEGFCSLISQVSLEEGEASSKPSSPDKSDRGWHILMSRPATALNT